MSPLRTVRFSIVWLTLSAYLFLTVGGAAVVLCEGADGHAGIELHHAEGDCPVLWADTTIDPAVEDDSSPFCEDTPIDTPASAERTPPRSNLMGALLLPAPLLPQWAWTALQLDRSAKVAPAPPPAAPSHLDAVHSVVLLI